MGRTPYVLEVTSPGVDRPLTEPRHWRRNTGRLVAVAVGPRGSADEVTGRVTAVDDAGVTLAVEAKGKPGAKKRPPTPRAGALGGSSARAASRSSSAGPTPADDPDDGVRTTTPDDDSSTDDDARRRPAARGGDQ